MVKEYTMLKWNWNWLLSHITEWSYRQDSMLTALVCSVLPQSPPSNLKALFVVSCSAVSMLMFLPAGRPNYRTGNRKWSHSLTCGLTRAHSHTHTHTNTHRLSINVCCLDQQDIWNQFNLLILIFCPNLTPVGEINWVQCTDCDCCHTEVEEIYGTILSSPCSISSSHLVYLPVQLIVFCSAAFVAWSGFAASGKSWRRVEGECCNSHATSYVNVTACITNGAGHPVTLLY